jgi:hypothetical protein
MIFSLEALRARHGDCLLLHCGTTDAPLAVLIDGGPGGVYGDALKPRLTALRDGWRTLGRLGDGDPLLLEMIMVSHVDDDHIGGLLGLTGDLLEDPQHAPWLRTKALWHNSFPDLSGDDGTALDLSPDAPLDSTAGAVIASVPQGNTLRRQAETLHWGINAPFGALVRAPAQGGGQPVALDASTRLRVIAPQDDDIEGLRKEWAEQMRRVKQKEASAGQVAEYLDESPFNLSSIVCLVEQDGHRILLTGDARGDHVLNGLDAAGASTNGATHVDVLKLPHHGSIRNVGPDFFERLSADHSVISANGRFGNPESETLELIVAARDDDFTIHLTYAGGAGDLAQRLQTFVDTHRAAGRTFGVSTRDDPALSLRVDLADAPPA